MSIKTSDLLINLDGSIYHLGLKSTHIPDNIIVVGDMDRVDLVGEMFETITHKHQNREFRSICGTFNQKPVMVISSGIGAGAIDILINELDALVNIDLLTREQKKTKRSLNFFRIGTTGAVADSLELGEAVISHYTIGIDGLAHFYKDSQQLDCLELSSKFHTEIFDSSKYLLPYSIECSPDLVERLSDLGTKGITMCAGGFFAPQGRTVRLETHFSDMIDRLSKFSYKGIKFTNIEMEGAAIAALAQALGHKSVTIALAVAHRYKNNANVDYRHKMEQLIRDVLIRL